MYYDKAALPGNGLRLGRAFGPSHAGTYMCQYILTAEGTVISFSSVESVDHIKDKYKLHIDTTTMTPGEPLNTTSTPATGGGDAATEEVPPDATGEEVSEVEKRLEESLDEYEKSTEQETTALQQEMKDYGKAEGELAGQGPPPAPIGAQDPQPERAEDETKYAIESLIGHVTKNERLFLKVRWSSQEITDEPFTTMSIDVPELTAEYLDNVPSRRGQKSSAITNVLRWKEAYLAAEQDEAKIALVAAYARADYFTGDPYNVLAHVESDLRGGFPQEKLQEKLDSAVTVLLNKIGIQEGARIQYVVEVPRTYREAVQLEKETGLPWTKATQVETTEKLVEVYDSFELLKDGETPPGPEFQRVKLKTI